MPTLPATAGVSLSTPVLVRSVDEALTALAIHGREALAVQRPAVEGRVERAGRGAGTTPSSPAWERRPASRESTLPAALSTGFAALDAAIGGGFPRGQVTELSGAMTSGKASLALGACVEAIARREVAVWIDAGCGFWPLPALEAGCPVDRLVVVRVDGDKAACRAAELLLAVPGAAQLVVVDLVTRLTLTDARLARLRTLAERSGAALVFLNDRPVASASLGPLIALRLCVRAAPGPAASTAGAPAGGRAAPGAGGDGGHVSVEVARNKRGPDGLRLSLVLEPPDRVAVDSTV